MQPYWFVVAWYVLLPKPARLRKNVKKVIFKTQQSNPVFTIYKPTRLQEGTVRKVSVFK